MLDRLCFIFYVKPLLNNSLNAWLAQCKNALTKYRIRQFVILLGEQTWAEQYIDTDPDSSSDERIVYNDKVSSESASHRLKLTKRLGVECHEIVYVSSHLSADVFALLSGTLKAGGVFYLVLSPEAMRQSLFTQYFVDQTRKGSRHLIVEQTNDETRWPSLASESFQQFEITDSALNYSAECATHEQYQAVEAICRLVQQKRKSQLVITADRGRGKSSALAIATARLLLNEKLSQVLISAAKKSNLTVFFHQLRRSLFQSLNDEHQVNRFIECVEFRPVDELIREPAPHTLVLIDEAAAIPVPMLNEIAHCYKRSVFSTTIHGYEGAGRGFSHKFLKQLQQSNSKTQVLHINQPVRWSQGCPLEALTFDALLLNAEVSPVKHRVEVEQLTLKPISKQILVSNNTMLRQVFSLLVSAHYQTSTSDLQLMLDNEAMEVFALVEGETVFGVALLVNERPVEQTIREGVIAGKRRIKDHFTAQSLSQHLGFHQALAMSFCRVSRIAIHPDIQGNGLGQYFIEALSNEVKHRGFDAMSTSYGVNRQLLGFWQKQSFDLVRIGTKKDQASGEYSGLMVKPFTDRIKEGSVVLKQQFIEDLVSVISQVWSDLDFAVFAQCLTAGSVVQPSQSDFQTVSDFINGQRQFLPCLAAIRRVILKALSSGYHKRYAPLVAYCLFNQPLSMVNQVYGFTGRKAFEAAVKSILEEACDSIK